MRKRKIRDLPPKAAENWGNHIYCKNLKKNTEPYYDFKGTSDWHQTMENIWKRCIKTCTWSGLVEDNIIIILLLPTHYYYFTIQIVQYWWSDNQQS